MFCGSVLDFDYVGCQVCLPMDLTFNFTSFSQGTWGYNGDKSFKGYNGRGYNGNMMSKYDQQYS